MDIPPRPVAGGVVAGVVVTGVSGVWATLRNPFQRIIVVDALGEKNNLPISLSVISNRVGFPLDGKRNFDM
jgi:hypothetical protein